MKTSRSAPGANPRGRTLRRPHGARERVQQLTQRDGLRDVTIRAALLGFVARFVGGIARHHDRVKLQLTALELTYERDAAFVADFKVDQGKVEDLHVDELDRVGGRRGGLDDESFPSEHGTHGQEKIRLVVHDEDGNRHSWLW